MTSLLKRLRDLVAGDADDGGSECLFFPFGTRFGVKAYRSAAERDFAFERQRAAAWRDVGPWAYMTFDARHAGQTLFGYVTRRLAEVPAGTQHSEVLEAFGQYEDVMGVETWDARAPNLGVDEFGRLRVIDFGPLMFGENDLHPYD